MSRLKVLPELVSLPIPCQTHNIIEFIIVSSLTCQLVCQNKSFCFVIEYHTKKTVKYVLMRILIKDGSD